MLAQIQDKRKDNLRVCKKKKIIKKYINGLISKAGPKTEASTLPIRW